MSIFGPWPGGVDTGTPGGDPLVDGADVDSGAAIPWPWDAPDLFDQITIAGWTFAALVVPSGELACKLDVKNPKGADGATITDDGTEAESGEIVITMWRRDQWENYQLALPFIAPNAVKGTRKPVDVTHPMLNLHGIRSIYVEKMTVPVRGKVQGTLEVRIRYRGWRPAPKTPAKSKTKTDESTKEPFGYVVEDGVDKGAAKTVNNWVKQNGGAF